MQSNNLGVFKRQKWITGRFSCLSFLCRFTCALHHVAHSVAAFVVFNSEWWLKYACATRYLAVLWTICESATEFARNAFSVLFPGTRWSSVWLDFCVWIIRMVRDLGCCEQHENVGMLSVMNETRMHRGKHSNQTKFVHATLFVELNLGAGRMRYCASELDPLSKRTTVDKQLQCSVTTNELS